MTWTEPLLAVAGAVLGPFGDPASRTWWPLLLGAVLLGGAIEARRQRVGVGAALRGLFGPQRWTTPSARLDLQLLAVRQLGGLAIAAPAVGATWAVATGLSRLLDDLAGIPTPPPLSALAISTLYSAVLFVAWDASRYAVHRLMHAVPALWAFHQVHHSATDLTPLTFHRVHPVESLVMGLRGVLVTGVVTGLAFWWARGTAIELTFFGVSATGLTLNALSGNLRHSHAWWSWGGLERLLVSPAQHQLHHSAEAAHQGRNLGTWLAVWDRLGGTWTPSPAAPPASYGLTARDAQHDPTRLISALLDPFRAAIGRSRALPAAAALLLAAAAHADEPVEPPPEEPAFNNDVYEIVVVQEGLPRVAGSAHVIGEEELERHAYGDVHKVLASVPGVYVRTEDGFGLRPNIGMRGANSDRSAKILLMEDGVPLAPAPYAAPAAYYFPLMTRMTGVEVIKGPAAIRFGPQTIGGALNLVTRAVPDAPTGGADVSGGSFGTLRADLHAGAGNDHLGVIGEFAHISSGGFKELDTGGPTGFTRQDAMLKARAGAASGSDGHSVELKLGYGRERSYETYLGLTPDDFADDPLRRYAATDGDLMTWQRWQAEATWRVRADGLDLRTTVYSHRLVRAWEKFNGFASGVDMHGLMLDPGDGQGAAYLAILRGEEDTASPDQAILRGLNDRRYTASGLATRLRLRTPGERVANELELGLRAHVDDVTRLHSETPHDMVAGQLVQSGDPAITLDARESAWALAAHAHDDMTLGALHLLPGVRIEAIRTATGTAATGPVDPVYTVVPLPGLGAYLGVTPWLDLLGGAHRGFSPASPAATAAGTPPETAWNAEAGLRAHPAELQLEAIGFLSAYGNLVGECTLSSGCTDDQLGQQLGAGAAWVYGVESLLSDVAHLPGRLDLRGELTYTWTATQFRTSFLSEFPQFGSVDAGDALPYVPAHQGSASAGLEHRLFALDATVTARSGMRDVAGTGPLEPEGGDIAGIVVADLAAAARPHEGWELYCTVSNITDTIKVESWRPAGARPGAPRTVLAGVRADF